MGDDKSMRLPAAVHSQVKDYAEARGISIKDAAAFLIEQGLRWNDAQEEVLGSDE